MKISLVAATSVAVLFSVSAWASGKPATSRGASDFTPGYQNRESGPAFGTDRPGASGYSPGYMMQNQTTTATQTGTAAPHGASSFAPGNKGLDGKGR
jgi:hypothetical protein